MAQLFTNGGYSTLASGISSGATSLSVQAGHGVRFPNPTSPDYFLLTLTQAGATETSWEIVKCTARSGDTLTISRGQEGTSAVAWSSGDKVELRLTAGWLNGVVPGPAAWVNFNGTGTPSIRASYNVTSITDNGVGDYTVNFTNALPDTNYVVATATKWVDDGAPAGGGIIADISRASSAMTTSGVKIRVASTNTPANLYDAHTACISIFR